MRGRRRQKKKKKNKEEEKVEEEDKDDISGKLRSICVSLLGQEEAR